MLHKGVAEVLMAGEQGLPAAYDIKVKDGQVLHKAFPFVYRRIGSLVGSRADVDPVGGFGTPHYQLVLLVGRWRATRLNRRWSRSLGALIRE
jgi:hypothetical protein